MKQVIAATLYRDFWVSILFVALILVSRKLKFTSHRVMKSLWIIAFVKLATDKRILIHWENWNPSKMEQIARKSSTQVTEFFEDTISRTSPTDGIWMVLTFGWLIGVLVFVLRCVHELLELRAIYNRSISIGDHVYEVEDSIQPFLFGILRPKIIMPSKTAMPQRNYILLHEKRHIAASDHIIKPVIYAIVVLHWYNPFAWVAFKEFSNDIELACDEYVTENLSYSHRIEYAEALLASIRTGNSKSYLTNTFGSSPANNAKRRIENIMRKRTRNSRLISMLLVPLVLCSCVQITRTQAADEANAERNDTTIVEPEMTASETGEEIEQKQAVPSAIYVPAEFENLPQQIYDLSEKGGEKSRHIWRVATPDSRQYVVAQWVAKGTDTIDWTNSTSQQIDGKTVYILDSADSITFSSDFGQYAYNLPKDGNSVLYFSTDTTDCYVYGTIEISELEQIVKGISIP